MAQPTTLEELMLNGNVGQPKIRISQLIVCYEPESEPKSVITYFYDDNDWGRIAYSYGTNENGFFFKQLTKKNDIFIAEGDIQNAKNILLEEAKRLDAIVLFYSVQFNNEVGMDTIETIIGADTARFTIIKNLYH